MPMLSGLQVHFIGTSQRQAYAARQITEFPRTVDRFSSWPQQAIVDGATNDANKGLSREINLGSVLKPEISLLEGIKQLFLTERLFKTKPPVRFGAWTMVRRRRVKSHEVFCVNRSAFGIDRNHTLNQFISHGDQRYQIVIQVPSLRRLNIRAPLDPRRLCVVCRLPNHRPGAHRSYKPHRKCPSRDRDIGTPPVPIRSAAQSSRRI